MSITNEQRARWAEAALQAYATGKEGGEALYDEPALVVSDLLADLMHYAAREAIDIRVCYTRARGHFEEERAEEYLCDHHNDRKG